MKGFENLVNVKGYNAERIAKMSDSDLDALYFATNDERVLALIDAESDARATDNPMNGEPLYAEHNYTHLLDALQANTF